MSLGGMLCSFQELSFKKKVPWLPAHTGIPSYVKEIIIFIHIENYVPVDHTLVIFKLCFDDY